MPVWPICNAVKSPSSLKFTVGTRVVALEAFVVSGRWDLEYAQYDS